MSELHPRLAAAKARLNEKRLIEIDHMLTCANVPEWVENLESNAGVPANDQVSRLKWFLLRRKDVKPSERKHEDQLAREMKLLYEEAKKYL